jgi:FMN phosphatase YigB (HAD superfamily)
VLFDLFGTLLEVVVERLPTVSFAGRTIPTTIPRWIDLLHSYVPGAREQEVTEVLLAARAADHGDPTVECPSRRRFELALRRLGCDAALIDEAAVVLSRAHMAAIADACVLPPEHRAVVEAAGARGAVAIVTNFDDTAGAYALLARQGLLSLVDTVVVSEAVGRRKPHPLPVVVALRSLGVARDQAVLVGDSFDADVGAARAAGVQAVWVRRGVREHPPLLPSERRVDSLAEVPEVLGWR